MIDYRDYPSDRIDFKMKIQLDYPRAIELAKKVIRFTKAWKTFATAEQCLYWKVEQLEDFLFIIASFDVAYTHIDDTTIFTLGKEFDLLTNHSFLSIFKSDKRGGIEHHLFGNCEFVVEPASYKTNGVYYAFSAPVHTIYANTESIDEIIMGYIPENENETQKRMRESFVKSNRYFQWQENELIERLAMDNEDYIYSGEKIYDDAYGWIGWSMPFFGERFRVMDDVKIIKEQIDEIRKLKKHLNEKSCFKIDIDFYDRNFINEETLSNLKYKEFIPKDSCVQYYDAVYHRILRVEIFDETEEIKVINFT